MSEENVTEYTVYTSRSLTIIVMFAVIATAVIISILSYFFWVKPLAAEVSELREEKEELKEDVAVMDEVVEEQRKDLSMQVGK